MVTIIWKPFFLLVLQSYTHFEPFNSTFSTTEVYFNTVFISFTSSNANLLFFCSNLQSICYVNKLYDRNTIKTFLFQKKAWKNLNSRISLFNQSRKDWTKFSNYSVDKTFNDTSLFLAVCIPTQVLLKLADDDFIVVLDSGLKTMTGLFL